MTGPDVVFLCSYSGLKLGSKKLISLALSAGNDVSGVWILSESEGY